MTFEAFEQYQQNLIKQECEMASTKGKEYANSNSRFANFDRLAARLNTPRLQIALVYFTKHMDAIESYITRGRTYSTETIQGRILDARLYLALIGGMIEETEQDDAAYAAKQVEEALGTFEGQPVIAAQPKHFDGVTRKTFNSIGPTSKRL